MDAWSMYIRYVDFVAHYLYYVTQITSLDGGSPLIPIPMGPFWQRDVLPDSPVVLSDSLVK
jgi:hypothetical protein